MKLLIRVFFIYVFLIRIFAFGQNKIPTKVDSLKKYSYLIFSNQGQFKYSATVFFIRQGDKLFLVGAGHTFTGKNTITGVDDPDYPNSISVLLFRDSEGDSGVINIDISQIKKTVQPSTFTVKPEIYIYEVKNNPSIKINSIESFIKNFDDSDRNSIDSVIMFGYPVLTGNSITDYKRIVPTLSFGNILEKYSTLNYYAEINTYDKINYLMKPNNNSPMGGGFSGSPCFFKLDDHFYFGGVCIGGSINKRLIINVRPEEIIKLIR